MYFFLFKQKTAYEMRISGWSSDVCSSDLRACATRHLRKDVNAGPVAERRHHQRGVLLRGPRHQVRQMVVGDEGELAVGQDRRLRAPRGAGGVEEPAGIVPIDFRWVALRSEERREGKECVSTCRYR